MANQTYLYLMIKPPAATASAFGHWRQLLGLPDKYPVDRLHSTALNLGNGADWSAEKIARLKAALDSFSIEPFRVEFDRVDGRILRGRPGMAEAAAFNAALKRHLSLAGFTLPIQAFWLHLTLAYTGPQLAPTMIKPIGWLVEDFRLVRSVHGVGHEELGRWALERRQFDLAL